MVGYLKDLIGNYSVKNTRSFFKVCRWMCSASDLINQNHLVCRPIAHTCDNTIELSTDYSEFNSEMMATLFDGNTSHWGQ